MRLHKFIDQEMIIYMMLLHSIRTPGGHPEGYLEAFANLYKNFALTLFANLQGETNSRNA
jgi:hypothetical protein